jgi:hypothetical protein
MDVTNPGLVCVANQAFRPDLTADSMAVPLDNDVLVPVANQGEPPAENAEVVTTNPTPVEEIVERQVFAPVSQDFSQLPGVAPLFLPFSPEDFRNDVANQNLTAGNPAEFIVTSDQSIQTNATVATKRGYVVTSVRDADTGLAPVAATTRFKLLVAPTDLAVLGIPVSGRQIVFDDSILTVANEGATRTVSGYGSNFIVISRDDPFDSQVSSMAIPTIGDTFTMNVQRLGSETISRDTGVTENVFISPPPLAAQPTNFSSENFQGTVDVSTGPQPGKPVIDSGTSAPTAVDVYVANQASAI